MRKVTFTEWLESRDPELYNEIGWKKTILPLALMGGLGYKYLKAPSYEPPPETSTPITQMYRNPSAGSPVKEDTPAGPLRIELSGSGPFSMYLKEYTIEGASIGKIKVTADGVNFATMLTVRALVNRNTAMKMLAPGSTGKDAYLSTGSGGKEIPFKNQEVNILIGQNGRNITVSPDVFPDALKNLINTTLNIHVAEGWIKLKGTGTITLGSNDRAITTK